MNLEDYKIVTEPSLKYVIKNKKMSFFLRKVNPEAKDVENLIIRWCCVNHSDEDKKKQRNISGPNGPKWLDAKWTLRGVHTVVCTVKKSLLDPNPKNYYYVQHVISEDECLSYDSGTFEETENPFNVLHNLKKQIDVIHALEPKSQLSEDEESKYQERIQNMETYCEKLEYLLKKIPDTHKENFKIITARHYSNEYPDTNSILLQVCYFYKDNKAYLLDWTSPTLQGWCGVFKGEGDTEQTAVLDALKKWESDNRYPDGILKCRYLCSSHPTLEIPKYDGEGLLSWDIYDQHYSQEHQFTTDGSTLLDSISNALSWFAIGASIVAGAILIFIPGGQVATAALWAMAASAVAGSAASVINITQRYNSGFSNWKDDGIDSLTIIASILGMASMKALVAWKPLAFLPQQVGKTNAIKAILIGEVTANSVQTIMISSEIASAIYSTMEDKTIPPDEKLSRILRLIAAGITIGALSYVNIKSSLANFNFISEDASLLKKLTKEEVDAILNDPSIVIIEHGETLPPQSTAPATIPETRAAFRQLQEFKLLPLLGENIEPPSTLTQNIFIPSNEYLHYLNINPEPEIFLKNEINKHLNLDNPYEATKQALLPPSSKTPESDQRVQVLARIDNQLYSKTIVNSIIAEARSFEYIANYPGQVRAKIEKDAKWKKRVAISKATCTIKGIIFENAKEFGNLPFDLQSAIKAKVVVQGKFTGNSAPISVIDIEGYIATLRSFYPDRKMDKLTAKLIKNYLIKHKDHLSNFNGMPGAHAEIVAVDDVFKQLRMRGLDPEEYLHEIEVYTFKTKNPKKDDYLKAFKACANCSGILDPLIKVRTGREG
ncbi:YwqJ-related putative deaminase [Gilliamella sp. Pas-s27]|uniref:YwqJ-related putative deaminase n=1 Tax=Gilliamella sp. Pas-s27 TaxID=2687311 RepID=UPI001365572F|nr:YwqJ-related putative deaminase [Gilliamella sp. Pas-s27]MWP47972.1 hypothetical protein [Gilliamella sp. Pas-s27]